ncbi:uncharacterized protein AB675_11268 [Cyphellophora attinorum]|uniref:Uncharacterized protein n=1 Tax=Cyphellophora attinorum TaxID=1664694 RepID=A0A0N1H940_9EURO|nr:uncharacterized protein AB675_11268 [Phialophora attinorum]KPI39920.1 hypothetical protein AB675_11268 [Phialophora attinorum]
MSTKTMPRGSSKPSAMATKTIDQLKPNELQASRSDGDRLCIFLAYKNVTKIRTVPPTDAGTEEPVDSRAVTALRVISPSYPLAVAKAFSSVVAEKIAAKVEAGQLKGSSLKIQVKVSSVSIEGSAKHLDVYKALFDWFLGYCDGDLSAPVLQSGSLVSAVELIRVAKAVRADAIIPILVNHLDNALKERSGAPDASLLQTSFPIWLPKGFILIDSQAITSLWKKDESFAKKFKARVQVKQAEIAEQAEALPREQEAEALAVKEAEEREAMAAKEAQERKLREQGARRQTYSAAVIKGAESHKLQEHGARRHTYSAAAEVSAEQQRREEEARLQDEARIRDSRFGGGKKRGGRKEGGGKGSREQVQP